ncbi:hypothetical protein HMPREF9963_0685 [Streptococcus dysgalactiae subsp. equisimilis SK1250]|nr:hypothetical protein HMPREF9963_0685 [Streptococcus dysgalactiae subsp. equisimilis SK1250]
MVTYYHLMSTKVSDNITFFTPVRPIKGPYKRATTFSKEYIKE